MEKIRPVHGGYPNDGGMVYIDRRVAEHLESCAMDAAEMLSFFLTAHAGECDVPAAIETAFKGIASDARQFVRGASPFMAHRRVMVTKERLERRK